MVIAGDTAERGVDRARPLRAGRARPGRPAGRGRGGDGDPRRDRGGGREARGGARASPTTRRWRSSRSPTPSAAVQLANAIAPEHLELAHRGRRRCSPSAVTTAGCVFVGERRRDRLRRLRRRLEPRPADRRRRALPGPARARAPSGAGSRPSRCRRTRPGSWPRRSLHWPAPRASRCTPSRRSRRGPKD